MLSPGFYKGDCFSYYILILEPVMYKKRRFTLAHGSREWDIQNLVTLSVVGFMELYNIVEV